MAGMIVLFSQEAAESYWVGLELHVASRLGRPGCLVLFPGVSPPAWAEPTVAIVELEGFKDCGAGLPPGTDEGQFFQSSLFVHRSLRSIVAFAVTVLGGEAANLPFIPRPDPAGFGRSGLRAVASLTPASQGGDGKPE